MNIKINNLGSFPGKYILKKTRATYKNNHSWNFQTKHKFFKNNRFLSRKNVMTSHL